MSNPTIQMEASDLRDCIKAAQSTSNEEGVIRPKDDRWILKTVDPSNVILTGVRVPEDAMQAYDVGDGSEFSVKYSDISNLISDASQPFEVEHAGEYLYYRHLGNEAQLGVVPPENVTGNALETPSLDQAVKAEGDINFLTDFISRAESVLGTDTVLFAAREEGLYLYSDDDGPNMNRLVEWEEFDKHSIDLDKAASGPDSQPDVKELGGVDSVFSLDFLNEIYFPIDTVRIGLDHHNPVKFVLQLENGIAISYILSPRIPSGQMVTTLPDRVRNKSQQSLTQG